MKHGILVLLTLFIFSSSFTADDEHNLGEYTDISLEDMRKQLEGIPSISSGLPAFPPVPQESIPADLAAYAQKVFAARDEASSYLEKAREYKQQTDAKLNDAASSYRLAQNILKQAQDHHQETAKLLDTYSTYSFEKHIGFVFMSFCTLAVPFSFLIDILEYVVLHYGFKLDEKAFPHAYAWIKKECAQYELPEHLYVLGASLLPHEWLTPPRSSPIYSIDTPISDIAKLEALLVNSPDSPELDRYRAAIYIACTNLLSGFAIQQDSYLRKSINYTCATFSILLSSLICLSCKDAGIAPKIMSTVAFCFAGYKVIQSILILNDLPKKHTLKAIEKIPVDLIPGCIDYFELAQKDLFFSAEKAAKQEYINKLKERLSQQRNNA